MSIQAVAWAIEHPEVEKPATRLVLISLANYAGVSGTGAWPSVATIARHGCLSERQVKYELKRLKSLGIIRLGNQALAAAVVARADRRPIVYDLVMERGASDAPRTGCNPEGHGVQKMSSRGAQPAPDPKRSVRKPSERRNVLHTGEAERNREVLRELVAGLRGKVSG